MLSAHWKRKFLRTIHPWQIRKRVIIGTKTDLDMDGKKMKSLQTAFPNDRVMGISVFTRTGLDAIMDTLLEN